MFLSPLPSSFLALVKEINTVVMFSYTRTGLTPLKSRITLCLVLILTPSIISVHRYIWGKETGILGKQLAKHQTATLILIDPHKTN